MDSLPDREGPGLPIDVLPPQTQHFTTTQPQQPQDVGGINPFTAGPLEQQLHLIRTERPIDIVIFDQAGNLDVQRDIACQDFRPDAVIQRGPQSPVRVPDRARAPAALAKGRQPALHIEHAESDELLSTEIGIDVTTDVDLIALVRRRPAVLLHHIFQPRRQEVAHRRGTGGGRYSGIATSFQFRDFRLDRLGCFPVDN